MSAPYWDDFSQRIAAWQRDGDSERLGLVEFYHEAYECRESDPARGYALLTQARDEARRLNERWWVLFFESERLSALVADAEDFARAQPLAHELMLLFHAPEGQTHPRRASVLNDVLSTYLNIDPVGYRNEIERGFAYLDGQIAQGPTTQRFVLQFRQAEYLQLTDRHEEARELALRSLALADQSRNSGTRIWHGAWALYQLCRLCHLLGRMDEVAEHADHVKELSARNGQLRRTEADGWIWGALAQRVKGEQQDASRSFQKGMRLLGEVDLRESFCADPIAAYHEACGDLKAAVGVRDRELAEITEQGKLHRICQVHVERCRLLARLGVFTANDLDAARLAASKLRAPQHFLEKLDRIR